MSKIGLRKAVHVAMASTRIPLIAGHMLQLLGLALALGLLNLVSARFSFLENFLLLSISWVLLWFMPHCLAHYLCGRLLGIRFLHYFITRSTLVRLDLPAIQTIARNLPVLGIRIDRNSLTESTEGALTAMFWSGPLASMLLPTGAVLSAFLSNLTFLGAIFAILTIANAGFTLYFSPRVGDFSKVREYSKLSKPSLS